MKMDNSPSVPEVDLPVLNFIRQKYVPANVSNATVRMSTAEIVEQVQLHMGAQVYPDQVYAWLSANGYTYDTVGDLRFEWLMKEAI